MNKWELEHERAVGYPGELAARVMMNEMSRSGKPWIMERCSCGFWHVRQLMTGKYLTK